MEETALFDGKYRILKTIGTGGTSTVFLAENTRMGTLWAIKEVRKDQGASVHFLSEPHVLKNLKHPALPRIFDIIDTETYLYLIQDYIEGVSLEIILRQEGTVPEHQLISWAIELCEVYEYLHSQAPEPIIYRDMKPSNLIVGHDGKIKVIDFGIARTFKVGGASDTVCLGTRGYASPEQYGTGQTDPRSDIYSLGVTLYHCLTGVGPNDPPYEFRNLASEDGPWSLGLARIIDRAIQVRPEDRFQSADAMKKQLKELIAPTPVEAPAHRNHLDRTGPLVFGIGGVERGCGSTSLSVELAHYLAQTRGKPVAVVEYNTAPCLSVLDAHHGNRPFCRGGVTYFPQREALSLQGLDFTPFREFPYVILDLGELKPMVDGMMRPTKGYYEMTRVHCPILLVSGAPWRLNKAIAFNYIGENLDSWNIFVTTPAEKSYKRLASQLHPYFNPRKFWGIGLSTDPFGGSEQGHSTFEALLEAFEPRKKTGKFKQVIETLIKKSG